MLYSSTVLSPFFGGDGVRGRIIDALQDRIRQDRVVLAVLIAADIVLAVIPVIEDHFDVAFHPAPAEEVPDPVESQAFAGIFLQVVPEELPVLIESEHGVPVLIVVHVPVAGDGVLLIMQAERNGRQRGLLGIERGGVFPDVLFVVSQLVNDIGFDTAVLAVHLDPPVAILSDPGAHKRFGFRIFVRIVPEFVFFRQRGDRREGEAERQKQRKHFFHNRMPPFIFSGRTCPAGQRSVDAVVRLYE